MAAAAAAPEEPAVHGWWPTWSALIASSTASTGDPARHKAGRAWLTYMHAHPITLVARQKTGSQKTTRLHHEMVMHVRGTAWPQGEGKLTELRTGYSPGCGGVAELLEGSGDAAQLRCLALEPSRAEGRLLEEKAFVCVWCVWGVQAH